MDHTQIPNDWREWWEERAAILEYDGSMAREAAEEEAGVLDAPHLCQRHGALVDKHFTEGLSPAEVQELAQLKTQLETIEAEDYAPIIKALRQTFVH